MTGERSYLQHKFLQLYRFAICHVFDNYKKELAELGVGPKWRFILEKMASD